jgi:molybdenum cofactor cytidylyltransferase
MTGKRSKEPAAGRIAAIVLGAGRSTRFGAQKLVARAGGEPVIRRTVSHVLESAVDSVTVVVGADADAVTDALAGLPVDPVFNAAYAAGMGGSIAEGVRCLPPGVCAVVIVLGDQPGIRGSDIDSLIEAYREGDLPIVVAEFDGTRVPPVLFGRDFFPALVELTGDRGARAIIERHIDRVRVVAMEGPVPRDIDTPADLEAIDDDR